MMNTDGGGLLEAGVALGPYPVAVSAAANDRYWGGAGVEHPARRGGLLYPPMGANLTILMVQTRVADPLLHTAQRLECHGRVEAPADLVVEGVVTDRYAKRDREYMVVRAVVSVAGGMRLWTSTATFTPVQR